MTLALQVSTAARAGQATTIALAIFGVGMIVAGLFGGRKESRQDWHRTTSPVGRGGRRKWKRPASPKD